MMNNKNNSYPRRKIDKNKVVMKKEDSTNSKAEAPGRQ
jgi:hypothetical protein